MAVVVALAILGVGGGAHAHVRATTVYATATSVDGDVDVVLSVEYDLLTTAAGLDDAVRTSVDELEQARFVDDATPGLAAYLTERFTISRDGVACPAEIAAPAGIETRNGVAQVRVPLTYECPGESSGEYRVTSDVFAAEDAVADDQTTILRYDLDGQRGTEVLDRSHAGFTAGDQHPAQLAWDFLVLGFEHLARGIDHVLFVVALLLGARGLRDVLAMASVFTVAHSLTLVAAAAGLVGVPAWLVEPLIALSIAFVALENLLEPRLAHRLPVVFGFGLLHGLGFAGALSIDAGWSWSLLGSLLSFNVGIEIGQLLVIGLVFPLLLVVRRTPVRTVLPAVVTTAVALVGLLWFAQRVPLLTDLLPPALA